ncbi:MAG TPA: Holliday junction branch migration protein RuvA [Steroidobacteraceae bacterium]|nr:Holliday junction branch migration protein RuvA [Steroidobacteraceae bacterium]
MIGFLRGRIAVKQPPLLVIEVNGVGYELEAPMSTHYGLANVGSEVTLFTHLVVREDAHTLYGFATEAERRLFRSLLKVSGVGPRIAIGILSGISADGFQRCVEAQDITALTRIPGVGRKTAERLLIEMRDRVRVLVESIAVTPVGNGGAVASPEGEAYSALIALGYKPAEATRLIKGVDADNATTEDIIRRALQSAARD